MSLAIGLEQKDPEVPIPRAAMLGKISARIAFLVFLGIPLVIGISIGEYAIERWDEADRDALNRERTGILDQVIAAQDCGGFLSHELRAILQHARYGWGRDRDYDKYLEKTRAIAGERSFAYLVRTGRIIYPQVRDGYSTIFQDVAAWMGSSGPRDPHEARRLDERLRSAFGPALGIEKLLRCNGEYQSFEKDGRIGVIFFEFNHNALAICVVIEEVPKDLLAEIERRQMPAHQNSEKIGKGIPRLGLWSPPPGIPEEAMQKAWAVAERENSTQVEKDGRHWTFFLNRWGMLTGLCFPVFERTMAVARRAILLLAILAAGLWGAFLLRRLEPGDSNRYLSIMTQVRLLFGYALLFPLGGAVVLGSLALHDRGERIRHAAFGECLERLNSLQSGFPGELLEFLAQCRDFRDRIGSRDFDPVKMEELYKQVRARTIAAVDMLHSITPDFKTYYSTVSPDRKATLRVLGSLGRFGAKKMLPNRLPPGEGERISAFDIMSEEAILSQELGWSSVVQRPDTLHKLSMARTPIHFYWDLYPGSSTKPICFTTQANSHDLLEGFYIDRLASQTGRIKILGVRTIWQYGFPIATPPAEIDVLVRVAEKGGFALQRELTVEGVPSWVVVAPELSENRFAVAAILDSRESLGALAPMKFAIVLGAILSLLVAGIAGGILSGYFLTPISDLAAGMEALRRRETGNWVPIRRDDEFGELARVFNRMMVDLKELELARIVQTDLLPARMPLVPGYSITVRNFSATDLAGDYHDVLQLPDGKILIVLGDATGHGVSAALVMAMAKAAIAYQLSTGRNDLLGLLEGINRLFFRELKPSKKFMTLVLCLHDPRTHSAGILNAGQNFPVLCRRGDGSVEMLNLPGLPVGFRRNISHTVAEYVLDSGDALIFYTDGIPESKVGPEELIGNDEMIDFFRISFQEERNAEGMAVGILDRWGKRRLPGPYEDDVTLLILRRD